MSRYTAMLDACSLVPIALTDILLRLAEAGLYRPLWSEQILDEMIDAIMEIHSDMDGKAQKRAEVMRSFFPDATVSGWEHLVKSIELPDSNDRHVVAAAIVGRADAIVTCNVKDFPEDTVGQYGIEIQTPDQFLINQLGLDTELVMRIVGQHAAATKNPPLTPHKLLEHLAKCGAPGFAQEASRQLWRTSAAGDPRLIGEV